MSPYQENLKQHWFVVCQSHELKSTPLPYTLLETPLVLFRSEGSVGALLDRCPHRNIALSSGRVKSGNIECSYHGWQFDVKGQCQRIPGHCRPRLEKYGVQPFECQEAYGFIWVKLVTSQKEIDAPPSWNTKNELHRFVWRVEANGGLENVLENFLDGTHTHFVHEGLVRKDGPRQNVSAYITKNSQKVEVCYTGEGKQSGIISRWFENSRKKSVARFTLPSVAEIEYHSGLGIEFSITTYLTPITHSKHIVHAIIAFRRRPFVPAKLQEWAIKPFLKIALNQDKKVLEQQQWNIKRFGGERLYSTEIDLIRPYILSLLNGDERSVQKHVELKL